MRTVHSAAVSFFVACGAIAQTTHIVGPGGFSQIYEATAVAAAGDVILVHPGAYFSFAVIRPMTIRAVVPGTVTATGLVTQITPALGDEVHLVGLAMTGVLAGYGRITFDDCRLSGLGTVAFVGFADVHFQDCTLIPSTSTGFPASTCVPLVADHAYVTATNTTILGSNFNIAPARPAVSLVASTLHGSHLGVAGGIGAPGPAAVVADSSSRVYLGDSTVTCDPAACPFSGGSVRVDRCSVSPACGVFAIGSVLSVRRLLPLQHGQVWSVEFRTAPGQVVGVFASRRLDHTVVPEVEQPVLLSPVGGWFVGSVVADPSGVATGSWAIPATPSLVGQALWMQGVSGTSVPMQGSSVVGGVIR
ncbi:MAG: hypothetical protein JNK15_20105 [Planctomycetes bacterium]|nr:hypothetical protein [Planctomycetota bacterium]